MNKRAIAACLSLFCAVSLSACKNNAETVPEETTETSITTLPVNVAEKWFEEATTPPVTEPPIEITTAETTVSETETETEPITTTLETVIETMPVTQPEPVIVTQPPKTIYVYETVTAKPETVYIRENTPDIHTLVPSAQNNVADSEALYRFDIDASFDSAYRCDLRGLTIKDLTHDTLFKPYTFDNSITIEENVDRDYFFESPLFGAESIKAEEMKISDVFDGCLFAVESVDKNGDVILNEKFDKLKESQYGQCYAKALHVSRFTDKDNINFTFYKGLHLGMTESEFYKAAGNYSISADDTVLLKNKDNTLLIKFAWAGAAKNTTVSDWNRHSGNAVRVIDEITLFNNDSVDLVRAAQSNDKIKEIISKSESQYISQPVETSRSVWDAANWK